MKKTKIVATIGPASSSKKTLREMMMEGMNVARINFSHGTYEDHKKVIQNVRELNEETGLHIGILADLQGPKIRTVEMASGEVVLKEGSIIKIVTDESIIGTAEKFAINYSHLAEDANPGEFILLDDGKLKLEVKSIEGDTILAEVLYGGVLSSHKGVNLPNTEISLPSLTEKDQEDLAFALEQEVDWIGLSFVRSARDIIELKHIISQQQSSTKIVAKIEKPEAVKDIDGIIQQSDAIMVARGDLGVEIPMEDVPMVQKMIVQKCYKYAKPVIIATQMMESMIEDFSPTRAEVNDVANAVLDGADAVMLSGETSVGNHPPLVIRAMSKIVVKVEESDSIYYKKEIPKTNTARVISDSICFSATDLSKQVEAQAIVTMSFSGYTVYKIASQRPKSKIFVFTGNRKILAQLNLVWGVRALFYDKMVSTDHTIDDIKYILKDKGYIKEGDLIINIVSIPITERGMSNMLKLSYVN